MSHIGTIARKELRATFLSPVALIFLGTFLLVTLFCFFWVEAFFTRNLADIRPLFEWLPLLLAFLVSALGMRLWSEERKMGTLEVLFTLPVPLWRMVLGKFLSGMALVALALALTLSVPITVEVLGDLDWGPVFGGYLAALLLAAAYLSIALWISSLSDNPLVALVFAVLACGALYMVGTPGVAGLFGGSTGDVLRAIGTSSRFESIGRGVVDLRDLAYYLSLAAFFLALNVLSLQALRWSRGPTRRGVRLDSVLAVVLLGANLLALNVWLAPVSRARVDLTADREYSISPVTRRLLGQLDEPLLIRGYISEKTHPLLQPLVPRIRDTIEEYGVIGGSLVTVEFVDPSTDEEAEKDANQLYGIQSTPFRFSDRHERSVVNAYFTLLVKYGDQFETLSWDQLVEVQASETAVNVRLRNLEYDLTRAIQKVVYGFASVETVFAQLPDAAKMTFYVTADRLPEDLQELPGKVEDVMASLAARSGGRFDHSTVDVTGDDETQKQLYERYGVQPLALSLFAREGFYLHLLLEVGDRHEVMVPADATGDAEIERNLVAALKRTTPAALKTVGLVIGGDPEPQQPTMPGMPPQGGQLGYRALEHVLGETYDTRQVDLKQGSVPGDVDVLIVLNPQKTTAPEVFALDQFLMRGGSVIIAGGQFALQPPSMMGIQVTPADTGLDAMLATYGLAVDGELVLDERNAPFPTPVVRDLGGFKVRDMQLLDYAPFIDVRPQQMDEENPALSGLPGVVLHWASPVVVLEGEAAGETAESAVVYSTLLRSSERAWSQTNFNATPDFEAHPDFGYPHGTTTETFPLAAAARGSLISHFKGRQPPRGGDPAGGGEMKSMTVLESSPDSARLVVIGSGAFVSDPVLQLTQGVSDAAVVNLQLVQNLVDWCLEDVELLDIRTRGTYARTLRPEDEYNSHAWEWGNYLVALIAVIGIGVGTLGRRRRARPIPLDPPQQGGAQR